MEITPQKASTGLARQLIRPVILLLMVIAVGTVGFRVLEDMRWVDAMYMSVITVSTVGFGEVRSLDPEGRLFTIVLIFVGVGAFTYFGGSVANYFVAGELRGVLERRRMENQIGKLSDHYIICGFGRMGAQVANELEHEHVPFVVLDFNEDAIDIARFRGHLALKGDAEEDSLLRSAGVERARGLIAVLAEDSSNLMVTVSARAMREDLFILARINRESSESKLMAAGANRVIWADGLAGRRIAQMALRPNVVEFLELVMHDRELELWMEEVPIAKESSLADTDLGSTRLREQTGVMIVAVRQVNGRVFTAPGPETRLGAGDIILVLGKREQISEARKLASIADADQRSQT